MQMYSSHTLLQTRACREVPFSKIRNVIRRQDDDDDNCTGWMTELDVEFLAQYPGLKLAQGASHCYPTPVLSIKVPTQLPGDREHTLRDQALQALNEMLSLPARYHFNTWVSGGTSGICKGDPESHAEGGFRTWDFLTASQRPEPLHHHGCYVDVKFIVWIRPARAYGVWRNQSLFLLSTETIRIC
jgi:hypothetical protein